jgi:hypothetical protein
MGTERTDYIIFGTSMTCEEGEKLFEDPETNELKPEFEKYNQWDDEQFKIIFDGMNGEYCVVGFVLKEADMDEDSGEGMSITDSQMTKEHEEQIREKLKQIFGITEPKIIPFTHWH